MLLCSLALSANDEACARQLLSSLARRARRPESLRLLCRSAGALARAGGSHVQATADQHI